MVVLWKTVIALQSCRVGLHVVASFLSLLKANPSAPNFNTAIVVQTADLPLSLSDSFLFFFNDASKAIFPTLPASCHLQWIRQQLRRDYMLQAPTQHTWANHWREGNSPLEVLGCLCWQGTHLGTWHSRPQCLCEALGFASIHWLSHLIAPRTLIAMNISREGYFDITSYSLLPLAQIQDYCPTCSLEPSLQVSMHLLPTCHFNYI